MQVYHFLSRRWGLDNLRKRRLRISTLTDLNDPFEFCSLSFPNNSPEIVRRERHIQNMAKEMGMICFSESTESPVQWAHYADRHRGICLGFEVPANILTKVRYQEHMSVLFGTRELSAQEIFATKFKEWEYEREWRYFLPLGEPDDDGHHFAPFNYELNLIEIHVGANCELKSEEIVESLHALGKLPDQVYVYKTRPDNRTFEMTKDLQSIL